MLIVSCEKMISKYRFFFLNTLLSFNLPVLYIKFRRDKRLWFSGRMRPCQGRDGSSILPSRTNNKLDGFFEANMRDARSASQWFPPEFRPESKREFAKSESKSGALARTYFSPRRRFEPKISLAQTFFAKRSESEAILSIFCATSSQFWKGSSQSFCLCEREVISSSSDFFCKSSFPFSARYISFSISWSR